MDDDDDEQWGGGGVNLRGTDRETALFDQYSTDFGRFCGSVWRGDDRGAGRPWREKDLTTHGAYSGRPIPGMGTKMRAVRDRQKYLYRHLDGSPPTMILLPVTR